MQHIHLDTIQQFNDYNGMETLHPLVSVIHVDNTEHIKECMMHYGFYAIYLKENKGCKLSYGRTEYDFDEMTVTSFAPGQTIKVEPIEVPEGGHVDDKGNIYSPLGELVGGSFPTGRTAKDLINDRILAKAKELLSISSPRGGREGVLSVSQISQRLGFEYPQHYVRFFKALTGKTPTQWRAA